MFCPKCGKENVDTVEFCSSCGENLKGKPTEVSQESAVGPIGILFFCIPLVGAIMYFVWKEDKPEKAKRACHLALWGVGVGIIIQILSTIIKNM